MTGEARLRTNRGGPHCAAECEDCGERWYGDGTSKADNARAAAKRHAEHTGHTVFVERSVGTYFNRKS
ncbi:MAG: hypothetical protein JWM85_329 [Acidimicrobiaceae bacterium]|nr:hypothetical protein [Acidimicrobiaceae bacterium]